MMPVHILAIPFCCSLFPGRGPSRCAYVCTVGARWAHICPWTLPTRVLGITERQLIVLPFAMTNGFSGLHMDDRDSGPLTFGTMSLQGYLRFHVESGMIPLAKHPKRSPAFSSWNTGTTPFTFAGVPSGQEESEGFANRLGGAIR